MIKWTTGMKASGAILALNLIAYGWVLWLMYGPPVAVFEFNKPVDPVLPVHVGEVMLYRMDVTKYLPISGHVTKQLLNATRTITLETIISNVGTGAKNTLGQVDIDNDIVPGRYKFKWTAVFQRNWARTETIVSESDWFDVLPGRVKK